MTGVKRNIVVNYLGQTWVAAMGLAFIPVYIRYLGMEAYGLIGLFAVMQSWLSLLDMGMTPTLNREMARFTAGARSSQSLHDLLRSMEMLCLCLVVAIILTVWLASDWLASDWLKTNQLSIETVSQSLSVMGVVVALRFAEGIYRGSLFGLQKQVWYNGASAILATVRQVGAVAILAWISPTIHAFFLWQAIVSLLTVAVFALRIHQVLPEKTCTPKFSLESLAEVWKFSVGIMGITLLSVLLTQVDKLILSRMLTLESFGYYTLAATIATVLYMAIGPITQAIYPRMVELVAQDKQVSLVTLYHQGSQLVTILTAPAALLLYFFPQGIIFMWSGSVSLAQNTAPILSALGLGTFLNGLMWMPYQLQLAYGWTSLTFKVNMVAVSILIPAIFWIVPRYGAVGAAWIWVLLNTAYVLMVVQIMHRRLMLAEKWRWYLFDLVLPISGSVVAALVATIIQPKSYQSRGLWMMFLLGSGLGMTGIAVILADRIRPKVRSIVEHSRIFNL